MNAVLLERAEKWLNELGIKTERADTVLKVNRTDMVSLLPGTWESQYDEVLGELKKALNSPRLFWGMKDDEWLYLEELLTFSVRCALLGDMTKQEAIAYLRKKQLLEKLSITTDTNPEAAAELDSMEKYPDSDKKDLTTDPSNV